MDILTLINQMEADGAFRQIANFPAAQLGTPSAPYLGATLLPERTLGDNTFTEYGLKWRTIIANDGSRHSSAQRREGAMVAEMKFSTWTQDTQAVLDSQDYDALIKLLQTNADMSAITTMTDFVDMQVVRALLDLIEKQRWEALINKKIIRQGNNAYYEEIDYPSFPGMTASIAASWRDPNVDPWLDISAMVQRLQARGREVSRIITDGITLNILAGNPKMMARMGGTLIINNMGAAQQLPMGGGFDRLNAFFAGNGLPAIERYDRTFNTNLGTGYFFPRGTFAMFGTTDRTPVTIEVGDEERILENTLGYVGIGRTTGEGDPGRVVRAQVFTNKPPRVVVEGWQDIAVVPVEADATAILTGTNL